MIDDNSCSKKEPAHQQNYHLSYTEQKPSLIVFYRKIIKKWLPLRAIRAIYKYNVIAPLSTG